MASVVFKAITSPGNAPVVYGWGSICKVRDASGNLTQYRDTDNEEFPEEITEKAWRDFMLNSRSMDVMHEEETLGRVVYAFPLTEDVAKAFGLLDALDRTGVVVGVLVDNPDLLGKFRSGEYTGFSIGGSATYEDLPDEA